MRKLKALGAQLKALRTEGTRAMQEHVRRHLVGHIQYYGVSGNSRRLRAYVFQVVRRLYTWLNRRSGRRSFNWSQYHVWLQRWLPRPRIVHAL